jgi:hypothetical protein
MNKINNMLKYLKLNKSEKNINKLIDQSSNIKNIINNHSNINNSNEYANKLSLLKIYPDEKLMQN